jgi:glycine cleavage system H protein
LTFLPFHCYHARLLNVDIQSVSGGLGMVPAGAKYTLDHTWCVVEGDIATIGVTEYALKPLGNVIYVDIPDIGDDILPEIACFEIEGDHATCEFHSPCDGAVSEVNTLVAHNPDILTEDPYSKGWLIKLKLSDKVDEDALLSASEYEPQAKRRRR